MTRLHSRLLWTLLAATLAARALSFLAVYQARPGSVISPDSHTYELPAQALLQCGRLAESPQTPDVPLFQRTPGYPLFIAAVERLTSPNRRSAILVQILLSVMTIAVTYGAVWRLWRRRAPALLTAVLLALDPASFFASHMLLTESLFTFLMACTLYCASLTARYGARRMRWALATVLCLALATLVRPVTYYAIAPVGLWLLLTLPRRDRQRPGSQSARSQNLRKPWGRTAAALAGCAAIWLALIGGWQLRNRAMTGSARFNRVEAINLYLYRAADVLALQEGVPFETAQARLQRQSAEALKDATLSEKDAYYRREARVILRAHPDLVLRSWARGAALLTLHPASLRLYGHLSGDPARDSLGADLRKLGPAGFVRKWLLERPLLPVLALAECLVLAAGYLGLPVALWRERRRIWARWRVHAFWLGMLGYLIAVSSGPESSSRMRVPLTPILAAYGGWLLSWLGGVLTQWRRRMSAG